MRSRLVMSFSGSVSRLAIAATLATALAACGTDITRFADTPLAGVFDPSGRKDPDITASLAPPAPVGSGSLATQGQAMSAPASAQVRSTGVSAAPLAPVSSAPLAAPVASAPLAAPQALPPVAQAQPVRTAPVQGIAPVQAAAPVAAAAGWTAQGGSAVMLGQGETIRTLANRYGVPEAAIRSANNITGNPAPGARVIIPVYQSGQVAKAAPVAAPAPAMKQAAAQPAPLPAPQQIATKQVAAAQPAKTDLPQKGPTAGRTDLPQKLPATPAPEPVKQAKVEPAAAPQKAAAAPVPAPEAQAAPKEDTTASLGAAASSTGGEFRWPAKGRIIQGFGGGSDGINIALPEGTPVKAVENGVVAYAGNELKGYGNLVLIRHDNGFVSAYANNGELKVKRGEHVKRGQTIATSGQTGNVSSPQLHFELRKGSTPVDPMPYLTGG